MGGGLHKFFIAKWDLGAGGWLIGRGLLILTKHYITIHMNVDVKFYPSTGLRYGAMLGAITFVFPKTSPGMHWDCRKQGRHHWATYDVLVAGPVWENAIQMGRCPHRHASSSCLAILCVQPFRLEIWCWIGGVLWKHAKTIQKHLNMFRKLERAVSVDSIDFPKI